MTELDDIAEKLDEETAALNGVSKRIDDLAKYGKRNRFLVLISIAAVVIAAIALTYAIVASNRANEAKIKTHDVAVAAQANRTSQLNTCEFGNTTRAQFKEFFLGFIPAGSDPNDPKIKDYVNKLDTSPAFAHRDCSALTAPVDPTAKPTTTTTVHS